MKHGNAVSNMEVSNFGLKKNDDSHISLLLDCPENTQNLMFPT